MKQYFKIFIGKNDGAVTVDWVVLTAAIVALGIAASTAMVTSTGRLSDDIWAYMASLDLFD